MSVLVPIRAMCRFTRADRFALQGIGIATPRRLTVALGSMMESLLARLQVLLLPVPCFQRYILQGAAVRKTNRPGLRSAQAIDGIEVRSRRDARLSAGQEH